MFFSHFVSKLKVIIRFCQKLRCYLSYSRTIPSSYAGTKYALRKGRLSWSMSLHKSQAHIKVILNCFQNCLSPPAWKPRYTPRWNSVPGACGVVSTAIVVCHDLTSSFILRASTCAPMGTTVRSVLNSVLLWRLWIYTSQGFIRQIECLNWSVEIKTEISSCFNSKLKQLTLKWQNRKSKWIIYITIKVYFQGY